jgi:hypothetical protein
LPSAGVYYFWPDDGAGDDEFLVHKILSNQEFKGHVIVAGDYGYSPEPPAVRACAERWGGELREVKFSEGAGWRQSGTFILAVLEASP